MDLGRAKQWLRTPALSVAVVAWLSGALVQTGAFGTVDTTRRYQVTRALWRGESPVPPGDFPAYGLLAPDGQIHAWYGIGQSLVMLPADLLAGFFTRVLGIGGPLRMKIEAGLVAFATFPAIAALNAALGYALLRRLGGFESRPAVLGVLGWLLATTVLPYSQVHFENSLDLCLSLATVLAAYRWATEGNRKALVVAGLATGLNVLTRLSNLADAVVFTAGALVAASATVSTQRTAWFRTRLRELAVFGLPLVGVALVADRAYQIARFGWENALTTYIHLFGVQARARHPELPSGYPFSGSFVEGFFGPLVSANRSMFLFDPLAVVGVVLFAWAIRARRLPKPVVALLGACVVSLVGRLLTYATYAHWDGSASWSNRFTLTPLQIALLFVIPTVLVFGRELGRAARVVVVAALALGVGLQLCGLLANPNLETVQGECDKRQLLLIPNRVANVAREVTGADPEGLSRGGCVGEEFRRVNLLPWGNGRDLPARARPAVFVAWGLLFILWLLALANALRGRLRGAVPGPPDG